MRRAIPSAPSAPASPARPFVLLALLVAGTATAAASEPAHSSHALRPPSAAADIATDCARDVYAHEPVAALSSLQASGWDQSQVAPAKPTRGVPLRDSAGTCVVRVTDHDADSVGDFARNDYSRRQAFNADSSVLLVYGSGGYWHLYDARSLRHLLRLKGPAGDAEPQWHPTDPNTLYYLPTNGGLEIDALDIRTNRSRVAANLRDRLPWPDVTHLWTKDEGSPSADGRYWGFQAEAGTAFAIRGYVVYDLQQDRIVGSRASSVRPDHVSMSPSGRWFVSSGDDDGTWAWSPDFSSKKKLHHKSEHSDLAFGADGHDLYVSVDFQSNSGDVFYVDIDQCPSVPATTPAASVPPCPRTVLFPTYIDGAHTSLHFSGKAYARPGWVVVSSYATQPTRSGQWPWYTNKIFALELSAQPRLFTLGRHEVSHYAGYWTEPHAAPNRQLDRVVFNSNWNTSSSNDVDDYMIVLREGALPATTPRPAASDTARRESAR